MKIKPITDKEIGAIIEELLEEQNSQFSVAERAARMMLTRKIRSTINEARVILHIKQYIISSLRNEGTSEAELNSVADKLIDQSIKSKSLTLDEDILFYLKKISESLEQRNT